MLLIISFPPLLLFTQFHRYFSRLSLNQRISRPGDIMGVKAAQRCDSSHLTQIHCELPCSLMSTPIRNNQNFKRVAVASVITTSDHHILGPNEEFIEGGLCWTTIAEKGRTDAFSCLPGWCSRNSRHLRSWTDPLFVQHEWEDNWLTQL